MRRLLGIAAIAAVLAVACASAEIAGNDVAQAPTPALAPVPTVAIAPDGSRLVIPTVTLSTAPTPEPIVLPEDEGPHGDQLEWWYYDGYLTAADGREFSFHYVIFKGHRLGFPVAYVGQLGVADIDTEDHVESHSVFVQAPSTGFIVRDGGWELAIDEDGHSFSSGEGQASLSLSLTPERPATLHNENGFLNGQNGWTYYYSWTRMDAVGELEIGGETVSVTGEAWMDHQWGDFEVPPSPAGWQWFAVQFDDGSDLMVTLNRDDSGRDADLYGTFVGADGEVAALTSAEDGMSIEVTDTWTSQHTGADYPAGWRVAVDSLDLQLDLSPLVADQEIPKTLLTPAYWEGRASVAGTIGGLAVSGRAYVELTGYAE